MLNTFTPQIRKILYMFIDYYIPVSIVYRVFIIAINYSSCTVIVIVFKTAQCTVNRAKKRFFKEKTKSLAEDPNDSKSFWYIITESN